MILGQSECNIFLAITLCQGHQGQIVTLFSFRVPPFWITWVFKRFWSLERINTSCKRTLRKDWTWCEHLPCLLMSVINLLTSRCRPNWQRSHPMVCYCIDFCCLFVFDRFSKCFDIFNSFLGQTNHETSGTRARLFANETQNDGSEGCASSLRPRFETSFKEVQPC